MGADPDDWISGPASSRVNPLPQVPRRSSACGVPVGAGLPAKGPVQANLSVTAVQSSAAAPPANPARPGR
ncbi:hypothetical protein C6A77_15190 [Pseudomonas sp. AFG_SD02_1510_Pfu_092]|nr:hypothetical protein C6A77_15190 [Pseudomonas sp. AFG_SD02_1510_Pfu_092]